MPQTVDDLSDVLERLRWSVDAYRKETMAGAERREVRGGGMRFHFVARGAVDVRGTTSARLDTGDFLLLPRGGDYTLVARGETVVHTGDMDAASPTAAQTVAVLPDVLVACCFTSREPLVVALIEAMANEVCGDRPGSRSVVTQLANVVAAAAIRNWVESGCGSLPLLSVPLRDSDVARALEAIHDAPGSPWTVEALARVALASRSAFAKRFRETVGDSPARYLARIRMEHAKRLLADQVTVAEVAVRLGYGSEAAFSRAFRRHAGLPPTRWRHSGEEPVRPLG
ncbi:AraC family transcriptional regulator [Asanoa sp. NPDC050611]|uniref:AraC family transcriptional regulator n=1 Tax=Asanoa sp. NPDC050611 TaxID=3157098 RepID=UPI0033DF27AA